MPMPTTAAGQPLPASLGRLAWATGLRQWLARLPPRLAALARRSPALARRLPALAREHWLLAVLLVAGLVLRILVQVAYRPALFYIDSMKYLFGAYPGNDPPGYQILIRPVLAVADPSFLAAVQHVLGLAMAVVLYVVLQRRGVPRWLAALAVGRAVEADVDRAGGLRLGLEDDRLHLAVRRDAAELIGRVDRRGGDSRGEAGYLLEVGRRAFAAELSTILRRLEAIRELALGDLKPGERS